jgi:hypothetical protein
MKVALGLILVLALTACTTLTSSFETREGAFIHKASQVRFAKSIKDWSLVKDGASDNLSSQIEVAVSYMHASPNKTFKPYATVYVVTGGNELTTIHNRALNLIPDAKLAKKQTMKLASGATANVEIYNAKASSEQKEGLVSVKKPVNAQSWFIQSKDKPNLVFWITINADEKDEAGVPLEFANDFLAEADSKL